MAVIVQGAGEEGEIINVSVLGVERTEGILIDSSHSMEPH